MTVFDQTSDDLKNSRLVMHKLGETFTDFKIRSFSVISLCEQWQTLQGTFAKVHNSLENRVKELELKESEIGTAMNNLHNLQTEVELRKKKLDFEEKSLSERTEFIGLREKEVKDWRESLELEKRVIGEQYKAVKVDEKRIAEGFERVKERMKVVEEKERAVEDKVEKMDLKAKLLNEREKELDEKEVKLEKENYERDESFFELLRKKKEVDDRSELLEVKEKEIDDRSELLAAKEKEVNERSEMLEAKEKRMLEDAKAMELELKQRIDEFNRQVELKEKEIEERSLALHTKEEQFIALQTKEKQFDNSHENEVVVRDDDSNNSLKSNENENENKHHEQLECDGHNKLSNCQVQEHDEKTNGSSNLTNVGQELTDSEIQQAACSTDSSSPSNFKRIHSLCIKMDAFFLGIYLSDLVKENTISPEGVLEGLRHAPDPGKLVIQVTRAFNQNFSDKNMTTIYKDVCILMLEQLMKLSPPITQEVKEEARAYAITLKTAKGRTPTDNFGFLQFVAAFKLANFFDADQLLSMFGSLCGAIKLYYWHDKLACLSSALGLSDKLPGLIKSYIQRNKLITAVKCICIFKLDHIFLPVPLLECYLGQVTQKVNDKRKEGTFNSEIEAETTELSVLQDVINCITTFKLESKIPTDRLRSRIEEVLKKKKARKIASQQRKKKRIASSFDSAANPKQLNKRRKMGSSK